MKAPVIIDFETFPIELRPMGFPPEPVGVAIWVPGKKPKYLAWGHPNGGNNCSFGTAKRELEKIWNSWDDIAFHNAKFDLGVAVDRMGLPMLPWNRIHDTMLLLFLDDPRAETFSLKPSAERLLNEPPSERDEMIQWLVANMKFGNHKLSDSSKSDWYAGKFVAYAPVNIAGPYAIGDVVRTRKLFDLLIKNVCKERNMLEAYNRERKMIPIMLDLESQGVRVNVNQLDRDINFYDQVFQSVDSWLCKRLKVASDTNYNSSEELAKALIKGKAVDRAKLGVGKKGNFLTNKDAISAALVDQQVGALLAYRSKLKTDLSTFMRPWYATARSSGGFIFTEWFSTRSDDHGTRTGRFSSSPNFQNMPKEVDPIFLHDLRKEDKGSTLPKAPFKLPPLPRIRGYIIPYDDGDVLIDRDYSQQELRILGHFENGPLLEAYRENPWMDIHDHTQVMVNKLLNADFGRKPIKNTNFGIVYGLGLAKLAIKSKCTVQMADTLRKAVRQLYPGVQVINNDMKRKETNHEPLITWGGREYYCEDPKMVVLPNGAQKLQTYGYRMLNILIQGSASECTKEAVIRFYEKKSKSWKLLTIPHDELLSSVPKKERDSAMECMRKSMESVEFKVEMLSEGKWSTSSWADLVPYDKQGKKVA